MFSVSLYASMWHPIHPHADLESVLGKYIPTYGTQLPSWHQSELVPILMLLTLFLETYTNR